MSKNGREDVFGFGELPVYRPIKQPRNDNYSGTHFSFTPIPSQSDWRLEVVKKAPQICGSALIFFGVLFGGSLLIANSSSDLKAWRGHALADSSAALIGLSLTAGGAYMLKGKKDAQ